VWVCAGTPGICVVDVVEELDLRIAPSDARVHDVDVVVVVELNPLPVEFVTDVVTIFHASYAVPATATCSVPCTTECDVVVVVTPLVLSVSFVS